MAVPKPWLSNNGLRAEARTSRSITLIWSNNGTTKTDSTELAFTRSNVDNIRGDQEDLSNESHKETEWYEVQMKPTNASAWNTVYRGFSQTCTVKDLTPDSSLNFRLRKNGEREWGTDIVAATDGLPPSAEDLHRAIQCNAEEMTLRIIGNTRNPQLKKLLESHDKAGFTPIMIAAQNGNNDIMNILIQAGADRNAVSMGSRKTPLMLAAANGHLSTCQLLDQLGVNWMLKDRNGCNILHYGVSTGSVRLTHFILKRGGKDLLHDQDKLGWTPLMKAIIVGNSVEVVKYLLQHGADPNSVDQNNTKSCLMAAVLLGRASMVEHLLKANSDPSYVNSNGTSVLDAAKGIGNKDIKQAVMLAMQAPRSTIAISI